MLSSTVPPLHFLLGYPAGNGGQALGYKNLSIKCTYKISPISIPKALFSP